MEFLRPADWADALAARAEHPGALPIAGGTDVMVRLNDYQDPPDALLDLTRVAQLFDWVPDNGFIRLGACVTYARLIDELGGRLQGLAMAAQTVGSAQIRNRGTIGGGLGSASSEGDVHPPLLSAGAVVEVASVRGVRHIPTANFYLSDRHNALAEDELIAGVLVPVPSGPERFSRIGRRPALAVAVASFAVSLDPDRRRVRSAFGAAAPTPRGAPAADEFVTGELAASSKWESRSHFDDALARRFGELVAAAASPIDDIRGTAEYRRLALGVLARRTLVLAWSGYQGEKRCS